MLRGIAFVAIFWLFTANFVFAAEKIDINTASLEELMKIVHIGEVRALELISLRPFASVDDLTRVKGIGETRIKDIKKQGLAWVGLPDVGGETSSILEAAPSISKTPQPEPQTAEIDAPEADPQVTEAQPLSNNGLAATGEQIPQSKGVSTIILFAALGLAVLSGTTILMLKKRLK